MQVRYQTDLYAGHLLVPIDHNIDCNKYSYKMLERNRIKGVLSCKKRTEDGKDCLCFDITGKKNLYQEYKDRELKFLEMTELFQHLVAILEAVREYLLTEKMALLEPEFIYRDVETRELFITILPWERNEDYPFRKLAEFFLEKIDLQDKNGISAAYHFYRSQTYPGFFLCQFLPILEKESILSRQNEKGEEKEESKKEEITYGREIRERQREFKVLEEEEDSGIEEKESRLWIYSILFAFLLLGLSFLSLLDKNQRLACIGLSVTLFLLGIGTRLWQVLRKKQEETRKILSEKQGKGEEMEIKIFQKIRQKKGLLMKKEA